MGDRVRDDAGLSGDLSPDFDLLALLMFSPMMRKVFFAGFEVRNEEKKQKEPIIGKRLLEL